MNRLLSSLLVSAVALATAACSPALTWREPISMTEHSPDAYVGSNMLVSRQVRMALPEGWHFKRRKKGEPEGVRLWIHDTGGNAVMGAYAFKHFDFPIAPSRATEVYAGIAMNGFEQKEAHRTEIDGNETHVILGAKEDTGKQRLSALIYEGQNAISDITLSVDPGYFAKNPHLPYAIFNSYKVMPRQVSERRIKGSFSFRCDDGSLEWFDDHAGKWESGGFAVAGKLGGELVIISIRQVSTARFQDFFKMERFQSQETAAELHFAGKTYPARVIVRDSRADKHVHAAYLFQHAGKDYLLDVFRAFTEYRPTDARSLHDEPEIRRALEARFYFDGGA